MGAQRGWYQTTDNKHNRAKVGTIYDNSSTIGMYFDPEYPGAEAKGLGSHIQITQKDPCYPKIEVGE